FLPAAHQGTLFRRGEHPVADIKPRESSPELQAAKLDLLRSLNRGVVERFGASPEIEGTIGNYELAFRMQAEVPDLVSLRGGPEATLGRCGVGDADSDEFGRQCLLARRMIERGVRFVELLPPFRKGVDRWDQHGELDSGHRTNARAVDRPIAALLKDLKG